jgi:hypothetical protein
MDYHLHQQGQTDGVFPLEELRRRRQAGELAGTELVWCRGMAEWQALDTVLQQETPADSPATLAPAESESKLVPTLMMVAVVFGGVIVLTLIGFLILYGVHGLPPALREAVATAERPRRSTSALAEASKPIKWTTNSLTVTRFKVQMKEFRLRQYLEGYQKCSEHKAAYDADALQLINAWIDCYYGGNVATNSTDLVAMCDKLAANPACDDPLVLTVAGATAGEMHESVRRLDLALKGYEHSHYKAYPRLYATVLLAGRLVDMHVQPDRVRNLDLSAERLLKEALNDGSIRPEDHLDLAETLVLDWGKGFFNRNPTAVAKIVEDAGKPYEWMALVLEGEHQINAAWKARGTGYVNTVKPEGWKGFHDHLAKARASLTKAWKLRPDLSLAPHRMIYVSLGDSGIEEMRLWFDRTVAIQFDQPGAWSQLRWGLRQRWYGDAESTLALGITAAKTRRYDTDVPRILFDSVNDLEGDMELPAGQHIYGREDIWPHLQQMYEGYLAEPSQSATIDGWRSTYATVAYFAGKYDVSRTQLEALNWQPWPRNLRNWGKDLSLMPLEAAARTGPLGGQVSLAESTRESGETALALQMYTDLSAATNADERTLAFVRDRMASLQMEQRLQTHDWVDFLPADTNLLGWAVERGEFTRSTDGVLNVHSDQFGHIIFSRARLGNRFEIKGTFEVVHSSTRDFQAGVVMGLPQFESWNWYGFRIKRTSFDGDVAAFGHGWSPTQLMKPAVVNSETNTFYLRFQNGLVTATVNDQQVFKDAKPPEARSVPTKELLLGLGAYNDTNDTDIRYRNVQVRKL